MTAATTERPPEVADEVVDRAEIKDGNVLVSYSKTEAALAELKRQFDGVQFEVSTPKGDKAARDARLSLVRLRTGLEAKRKEFKAPALVFGQKIDADAKRITAEIKALEDAIDAQIVAEEKRREADRLARIEAERVRVAALRQRIDDIAAVARRAVGKPAAEIEAKIALLVAQEIGPDFGDYLLEAERVHAEALGQLRELLTAAQEQEAETARLAAERAALVRRDAFNRKLDGLRSMPAMLVGKKAETIRVALAAMVGAPLDDWEEFEPQAIEVRDAAVTTMQTMLEAAEAAERAAAEQAEQRRLMERRAEFDTAMRRMRAHPDALYGCEVSAITGALTAFRERGAITDWPEFQPEADAVFVEVDALIARILSVATDRARVAAEQAQEAQRLADARAAQEQADAEAAESRRAADAQAAAERAEQDRVAREARDAEQRRQDEAAAELRQREIDLAERIAAENRVLPDTEPEPVIAAEPAGIPVHMDREHGGLAFGHAPVEPTVDTPPPAAEPELPTIKLGAIVASVGKGFGMTGEFVGSLGYPGVKGERGATLFTAEERRGLLLELAGRLMALAAGEQA